MTIFSIRYQRTSKTITDIEDTVVYKYKTNCQVSFYQINYQNTNSWS